MAKRKSVEVTVSWCYGDCAPTAKLSPAEWQAVLRGESVTADTSYWYEGEEFSASFHFNEDHPGTLRVSYGDDGGEGYNGTIQGAEIFGGCYPPNRKQR